MFPADLHVHSKDKYFNLHMLDWQILHQGLVLLPSFFPEEVDVHKIHKSTQCYSHKNNGIGRG
jgi:hypothetical protein